MFSWAVNVIFVTDLSHGGQEALRVKESCHPEGIGSSVKTPGVELWVPLNQLGEPETQSAGVPWDLSTEEKANFSNSRYLWDLVILDMNEDCSSMGLLCESHVQAQVWKKKDFFQLIKKSWDSLTMVKTHTWT